MIFILFAFNLSTNSIFIFLAMDIDNSSTEEDFGDNDQNETGEESDAHTEERAAGETDAESDAAEEDVADEEDEDFDSDMHLQRRLDKVFTESSKPSDANSDEEDEPLEFMMDDEEYEEYMQEQLHGEISSV